MVRKKQWFEGRQWNRNRSLGAEGDLLQVMDAFLVYQTHIEGGKVQDEALVELEGRENMMKRCQNSGLMTVKALSHHLMIHGYT